VLWKMQHKKCCYCERYRDVARESDIEHFRPKADVEGSKSGGYWWLAYEWNNLFFSCRYCNQEHKRTRFPLAKGKRRAQKQEDDLSREGALLVNPADEDPSYFIGFDMADGGGVLVKPFGRDKAGRGDATIEILGLDRLRLNVERGERLSHLRNIGAMMQIGLYGGSDATIRTAAQMIKDETAPAREFAALAREYFATLGFGEYVSKDK
jgi:uncharacterized protein (TIGR02646 family)